MGATAFHLAQLNIAKARASLEAPLMAGFVSRLDEINTLAERSPGFVWRLRDEAGSDATQIRAFDDPKIIVNLTVWESPEHLRAYAYRSDHAQLIRQRRDWFEPMSSAYLVLWWIPAGRTPSIEEAKVRLRHLDLKGPSAVAFSFKSAFPAPTFSQAEIDYDRRRFVTVALAGAGDAQPGTHFEYRQQGPRVWGSYVGDAVSNGSFEAQATTDGVLDMRYQHTDARGALKQGVCTTLPSLRDDGRLRLFESWRWLGSPVSGESELDERV
jgi:hypothetical protein